MAQSIWQTPEGVWTNRPKPQPAIDPSVDPNAPTEENGQLMQMFGGQRIPIGAAHNTPTADPKDAILADAHEELNYLNASTDGINESVFPKANQAKLDYPGAYDHLVSSEQLADFEKFLTDKETQAQNDASPIGQAANWLTPGKIGAGVGVASLIPGGALPAGVAGIGVDALARFLRSEYKTSNSATYNPDTKSMEGDNPLVGAGEVAAPAALVAGGGAALGALEKAVPALTASKVGAGAGAVVGGYQGYNSGGTFTPPGILGMIERGTEGAMGGGLVGKGMKFIRKAAGMAGWAPEAAAAEEAAFANPGAPLPRDPHALNVTPLSGSQVPSQSVDAVLSGMARPEQAPLDSRISGLPPSGPDTSGFRPSSNQPSMAPGLMQEQSAADIAAGHRGGMPGPGTWTNPHTVERLSTPPTPSSAGLSKAAYGDQQPPQGSNPVMDRSPNDIKAMEADIAARKAKYPNLPVDPEQADMIRRYKKQAPVIKRTRGF